MKVKFNKKPLVGLISQLPETGKPNRVQVGIFGDSNARNDGVTNAEIGEAHENGKPQIYLPKRSFLFMPLSLYLKDSLSRDWIKDIRARGMTFALKKLGMLGEATVQKAFATGGFGHWRKLRRRTIWRKGSSAILIDTSQLRRSISSRVA